MGSDLLLVVRFWGTLFLVGAFAYPLARTLFPRWFDHGYLFAKAVGLATVSWIVYVAGTLRVLPFSPLSIWIGLGVVFVLGILLQGKQKDQEETGQRNKITEGLLFVGEELLFFAALLFWSWIKGHEPSIRGLEKFMDFGFMQSIANSQYFPPQDMWYAGAPINYYYFGHLVTAVITKLSGLSLAYTFNLMLAALFTFTVTMSFSIGYELSLLAGASSGTKEGKRKRKALAAGALTAFLVTAAGNMQTIYAFTKGYVGENVVPFWKILWPAKEFIANLPQGLERYWYANATRFIPFTIHEFPSYSFVVSDVHGHVLSIPFVLLAIALLLGFFAYTKNKEERSVVGLLMYGFLMGVLLMTNAIDGPIYAGLFIVALLVTKVRAAQRGGISWKQIALPAAIVLGATAITSAPFLWHFDSFVSGIAVNCPPSFLANIKVGPILFEEATKCQHSPLWMLLLLWGFFLYCGGALLVSLLAKKGTHKGSLFHGALPPHTLILIIFFLFSVVLIIFPEFFYFKDIYPAHFRSNTMFKLGYQAFMLFSIVAGFVIVEAIAGDLFAPLGRNSHEAKANTLKTRLFILFLLPQLLLVAIYPVFSVRSYFGGLRQYEGLYGLSWIAREYSDDAAALAWLQNNISNNTNTVLLEADGDSYTDYARFSAFSGTPTVVGWGVHEWLWRGSYDVVSPRREDVRIMYESNDLPLTQDLFRKYGVSYVIVGALERQNYEALAEWKFIELGDKVFQSGNTTVYTVN
jgi:YYY domain-containing protein